MPAFSRASVSARTSVRCLSIALLACGAFACGAQTSASSAENPATVPADRLSEPWWAERHKSVLNEGKATPDAQLVLIGDSILNNYDKAHPPDEDFQPAWKQFYQPRKALNLGFSGDTTANVLWRMGHGEVEGLHPRVAMVLIGTNNTGVGNQTAEQTESGIDAVIADLENRLPDTRILLIGLLPSAVSDSKTRRDLAINRYLATSYGENPRVAYLDISSIFFKNGALNDAIFYDPRLPGHPAPLHPDTIGQRRMAEAIEPTLARLMGDKPAVPLSSMTDINTALIPVPWLEQDCYDWYARHHAVLDVQKQINPRIVMIGDSITHFWAGPPTGPHVNGPRAWKLLGDAPILNMGYGWDRTQNVLWRLRQGEFDGIGPAWVVILIGTNNLTGTSHARANTPAEIVDGIAAIVDEVHQRSPQSHIALMGILPRNAQAGDHYRAPIIETNRLLAARFASDSTVKFIDIGAKFLTADGSLPKALMPDLTHPSDAGYRIWANALIEAGVKP